MHARNWMIVLMNDPMAAMRMLVALVEVSESWHGEEWILQLSDME